MTATSTAPSNPNTEASISASSIKVIEALNLLDEGFEAFSNEFAADNYALWLGSGISRDRVANVPTLLARILSFLQSQIDGGNADCEYKKALNQILELSLSPTDIADIDFTISFESWTSKDTILEKLTAQYAKVLAVEVGDKPADYLYWDAINICETYAGTDIEPDCEHLCIAILALEGAISKIASANWDSLIEVAIRKLGGPNVSFKSCVAGNDLRGTAVRTTLIKFHGCALKAKENEPVYRPLLVARQNQIDSWTSESERAAIASEITTLLVSKKTLMVGLSAQDANIRNIIAKAQTLLNWLWPCVPPACIFATDQLNEDQKAVVQNLYGNTYTAQNRNEIQTLSHFPAYSKPLFVSLVLKTLSLKLESFIKTIPTGTLSATEQITLIDGIRSLRDYIATIVEQVGYYPFVQFLILHISSCLSTFRSGSSVQSSDVYETITALPSHQATADSAYETSGLREFSVILSLIGRGISEQHWSLEPIQTADAVAAVKVIVHNGKAPIHFVNDEYALLQLKNSGAEGIFVQSKPFIETLQRSPRGFIGRTGATVTREASIAELLAQPTTADKLFQDFRERIVA